MSFSLKSSRAIRSLMMRTDMFLETSVLYRHLTRLTARENFIGLSRRESTRACDASYVLYTSVYPKFPDWPPGARAANGTALCHYTQLYRYFVSLSSEFCRHKPLCCFSKSVYCCCLFRLSLSPETFGYTLVPCRCPVRDWYGLKHVAGCGLKDAACKFWAYGVYTQVFVVCSEV
jgi:hypothetical protein